MNDPLVKKLVGAFGPDKVKICTEFHIQVSSPKGKHNIWRSSGGLKYQLAGNRKVEFGKLETIISKIGAHSPAVSDFGKMEEARQLTKFISKSIAKSVDGIFVDAGWKNGKARIAIVCIEGERIAAESFTADHPDSLAAEIAAVKFALAYKPLLKVYSDCTGAVHHIQDARVSWIPRESNLSDKIGNMRNQ